MKKPLALCPLMLMLILTACRGTPAMTPAEHNVVEEIKSDLVDRCLGRYVMKVPKQAQMRSRAVINDVEIIATPMSLEKYRTKLTAYATHVRQVKSRFGFAFLYEDERVDDLREARYFITLREVGTLADNARKIEAFNWSNGYEITVTTKLNDAKHSINHANDPFYADSPDFNTLKERRAAALRLLSATTGRDEGVLPTKAGTCIENAFIEGRQRVSEVLSFYFVLPEMPDVSFDFETDTDIHSEERLLLRSKNINAMLATKKDGRTIRKGLVPLPGIDGEEWLLGGESDMRVDGFYFGFEGNMGDNPEDYPVSQLTLRVGFPSWLLDTDVELGHASLTEAQALAIWDAMSRNLRPMTHSFEPF